MDHQDWTPVVLKKSTSTAKSTVPRTSPPASSVPPPNVALDMDEKKVEFFTPAMGKKIAALRNSKNWSQEELAKQLNLPKKTITDLEQGGKEKYNGPLVSKLKKVLGNFSW